MDHLLIGIALLLLIVRRQLRPRPIKRDVLLLPLLLLAYGVYLSRQAGVAWGEGLSLALALALGMGAGWFQGYFIRIYHDRGVWYEAGSIASAGLWLLSIPIRYLTRALYLNVTDVPLHLTGSYAMTPFIYSIAGLLLGKGLLLIVRYPIAAAEASRFGSRKRLLPSGEPR